MTKKILTSEDSDLFRETIGKVRLVKNDKVHLTPLIKPKPFPKPQVANLQGLLTGAAETDIEAVGREDPLSFVASGLQKNILTKLRQGYFGLDAEIDLHGLSSNEAKRHLMNFLQSCAKEDCRCVHVVHGKGYRSQEDYPTLKNNVNLWLRQHKDVQAFCSAAPKDGGTGAIYVLLRSSAG
ncbi:MAG: Smr/MutS family protein [Methylovulum sp.]|nr:Smr/MutS family protein [Methylovulum sp.]